MARLMRHARAASLAWWRHRRAATWGPVVAALVGAIAVSRAGPVATVVMAAYGAATFVLLRGVAVRRSQRRAARLAADAVVALAADLRAGVALGAAWEGVQEALRHAESVLLPGWRDDKSGGVVAVVARRLVAATTVSQACGAPLAEVLDRLDAHLRAAQRAAAVAYSQSAGARVSAGLLAAMPVVGVALGIAIGVDAFDVLLHTPLGAAALIVSVALQLGGLAWAGRLAAAEVAL